MKKNAKPPYRPVTLRPDGALLVLTRSGNVREVFHPHPRPDPGPTLDPALTDDGEPLDMGWLVSVGGMPTPKGGVEFTWHSVNGAVKKLVVAYSDAHGWHTLYSGVPLPDRGRFRNLAAGLNITLTE